ncbi:hypothetical protein [Nocardia otitidiscaviarum]|uniref:hypothetical protein n=1 Tax=Nocardia otitidiscaviarum TaxID=1823 RepID=UPI0018940E87|nr:hypothetical protein [Nocardia otitidiscaviarum]MBF6236915.1 hypothetical protein [Nocardia otitidiscaviarum]
MKLRKSPGFTLKARKSTAILMTVWVATFVLYVFVKPEASQRPAYTPIVNSVLNNDAKDGGAPPPR